MAVEPLVCLHRRGGHSIGWKQPALGWFFEWVYACQFDVAWIFFWAKSGLGKVIIRTLPGRLIRNHLLYSRSHIIPITSDVVEKRRCLPYASPLSTEQERRLRCVNWSEDWPAFTVIKKTRLAEPESTRVYTQHPLRDFQHLWLLLGLVQRCRLSALFSFPLFLLALGFLLFVLFLRFPALSHLQLVSNIIGLGKFEDAAHHHIIVLASSTRSHPLEKSV